MGLTGVYRSIALTIILTRAGLGLDPAALKKLSLMVLRLAFCPSIVEVVMDSVAAHFFLAFPWPWAFMLGYVGDVLRYHRFISLFFFSLTDRRLWGAFG